MDGEGDVTAIVLAGGGARRLGQDKARANVAGESLLSQVLGRLPVAVPTVVVSPDEDAPVPRASRPPRAGAAGASVVTFTCEEPTGGGPVAGLAAGLQHVRSSLVLLLAVDMPLGVHAALLALDGLRRSRQGTATAEVTAVMPVDADGHRQPLAAAYRAEALRSALAEIEAAEGTVRGASVRSLVARLEVVELPDLPGELLLDVDTPEDLVAADRALRARDWGLSQPD
jgi:molybdopterin-guanine dinucleotide biosynthesis protein A